MGGGPLDMFGKSKATLELQPSTGITFADVAGCDEAKLELVEGAAPLVLRWLCWSFFSLTSLSLGTLPRVLLLLRSRRLPQEHHQVRQARGHRAARSAPGGAAGDREDAHGKGDCGRGPGAVLLLKVLLPFA